MIKGIPIKKYHTPAKREELGILTASEKNTYDQKFSKLESEIAALKAEVANRDSIIASNDQLIFDLKESNKGLSDQMTRRLNAASLELSLAKEKSNEQMARNNNVTAEMIKRVAELEEDKESLKSEKAILTNQIKSLKNSLEKSESIIDSTFAKNNEANIALSEPQDFQNNIIKPPHSELIGENAINNTEIVKSEYDC